MMIEGNRKRGILEIFKIGREYLRICSTKVCNLVKNSMKYCISISNGHDSCQHGPGPNILFVNFLHDNLLMKNNKKKKLKIMIKYQCTI